MDISRACTSFQSILYVSELNASRWAEKSFFLISRNQVIKGSKVNLKSNYNFIAAPSMAL